MIYPKKEGNCVLGNNMDELYWEIKLGTESTTWSHDSKNPEHIEVENKIVVTRGCGDGSWRDAG